MGDIDRSFSMKKRLLEEQEDAHLRALNESCQHKGTIRQISQCATVPIDTTCSVCTICHLHVHTDKNA